MKTKYRLIFLFIIANSYYGIHGQSTISVESAYESQKKNDFRTAARQYLEIITKEPTSHDSIWYNLAKCYRDLKEIQKAIAIFEKLKIKDYNAIDCDFNIGYCYYLNDQYQKAVDKYIQIKPETRKQKRHIASNLAVCYEHLSNEMSDKTLQKKLRYKAIEQHRIDKELSKDIPFELKRCEFNENRLLGIIAETEQKALEYIKEIEGYIQFLGNRADEYPIIANSAIAEIAKKWSNSIALKAFRSYESIDKIKLKQFEETRLKSLHEAEAQFKTKEAENSAQNSQNMMYVISFVLVIVVWSLIKAQKSNKKAIKSAKSEKEAKEEALRLKEEAEELRDTAERRQHQIELSIKAAVPLQRQIFPSDELLLQENIKVFFYPLHDVSGDGYYVERIDNKLLIIVYDGEGHSVVGAFSTIGAANGIKEVLLEKITNSDTLLNILNTKLRYYFHKANTVAASVIIIEENKAKFSGAKQDIMHYKKHSNELIILDGGRKPLAEEPDTIFNQYIFDVSAGDILLLYSDGLPDSYSKLANNRVKIGRKNTAETLKKLIQLHGDEDSLYEAIKKYIEETLGQRDDVTLLMIKI